MDSSDAAPTPWVAPRRSRVLLLGGSLAIAFAMFAMFGVLAGVAASLGPSGTRIMPPGRSTEADLRAGTWDVWMEVPSRSIPRGALVAAPALEVVDPAGERVKLGDLDASAVLGHDDYGISAIGVIDARHRGRFRFTIGPAAVPGTRVIVEREGELSGFGVGFVIFAGIAQLVGLGGLALLVVGLLEQARSKRETEIAALLTDKAAPDAVAPRRGFGPSAL
jgi:hypothetical protein